MKDADRFQRLAEVQHNLNRIVWWMGVMLYIGVVALGLGQCNNSIEIARLRAEVEGEAP